ncbi:MAG TPA: NAD(P)-binding domain-containing protein, partial [Chloroflexota bacterium]
MRQVGFIGVGTMGLPMARNLLRKGYGVVAYDVNAAALDEIARDGAVKAESPRNVAERVDVVITMLPSSPHVERVILGSDGVLEGCRPGGTIIDMSTIDPITTKKVAAAAAERGVRFLDAPVSGSTQGARDGTLTIMVGGPAEVLNEHYPILE